MNLGLTLVLFVTYLVGSVTSQCPSRCQCFHVTVRCMFLQLDTVPRVSPSTTILDLRFNLIKNISHGAFRDTPLLETLLLNNNEIETLHEGAFDGLHDLRYLYLYKNKLHTIEEKVFKHLHKLEQLYLHGNELKGMPQGLFTFNKKLKRLRLDSNPLACDCGLIWLVQMLKDNLAHTQAAATCATPSTLRGRSLVDINDSEFNCSTYNVSSNHSSQQQQQPDMPRITTGPTDVEITFGNTAYFRCRAEGNPQPEIAWMKNNQLVDPQGRYSILADGTLMIEDAQDADRGFYECIARNAAGETKTNTVELRMSGNYIVAPSFLSRPVDVQVSIGETVDLPCVATGTPQPEITWTLNGRSIRLNSRISIVGSGLHIISVHEEDNGDYRCMAENNGGVISTSARLSVQVAPRFVLRPRDTVLPAGSTAVLQCDAMGEPAPLISWFKNSSPVPNNGRFQILDSGRTLRITHITSADQDVYVCRAESDAGRMEAEAELVVSSQRETTVYERPRAEEVEADEGSNAVLTCTEESQVTQQYRWVKEGTSLRNSRKYVSEGNQLTIYQVVKSDEGLYECFSENSLGFARHSVKLNVRLPVSRPGDRFVQRAILEATNQVNRAISETRSTLFDRSRTHTVEDLLSVFRYPSAEALDIARAEEIFEQTLELIHRHVAEGHQYDTENFELSYQELVSPAHLSLIANMSGCFRRTLPQKCTNMCFHKKYRTLDGSCNNLMHPSWGSSNSALKRLLASEYENGFNSPKGWNKARLYNGIHLPSPRLISSVMMSTETVSSDTYDTHMVMQWGQFIDHDMSLAPQSVSQHIFNDGRRCNETCENSFPCFPIPVPSSDQRVRGQSCLGFHRSSATCNSGTTSIFFKTFAPRQQLNALTAFIDGSMIYGSSENLADRLRDQAHENGKLLTGSEGSFGKRLLPYDFHGIIGPADCQIESSKRYIPCFLAGDSRVNEQLGLTTMHTLWMREHNRIAAELLVVNSHWDGNMLYHESRKIIGAMLQHITYTKWLPKIFGKIGMQKLGSYKGYNPSVDPSISNEFATAAMRFGHSLIQPILFRLDDQFQPIADGGGNLPLHKAFFSPYRLVEEGGIDPILRGLFAQGAKMRVPNEIMNTELTEKLFALANSIGQDLASLNIQRGRDHGLPFYNDYRELYNMTRARSFNDLRGEIKDKKTLDNMELLYGHVDNIDLFVGGMAETPVDGAKVGPLFLNILVDQFKRLRDGDRFWYEDPMVFTSDQLVQIKQASLSRVLCDSSDAITRVQRDVFSMVQSRDEYIKCENIPPIDLKMWSDCCMDCGQSGDFKSITSHFRRRRQSSIDHSYQADGEDTGSREMIEKFREQVYNKHEMDHKMHAMQTKLQDMQGLVQSMEESMKKMKRGMRRMMSKSTDHMCMDSDGQKHMHGDKWSKDECTQCKCRDGNVKCKTSKCPPATCENPKKMPGVCCLIC